ncbi:hypothetical protein BDV96DRAFT_66563 [Lophiotrema nucula]|uniref:Uncharacterized protein n=1 Tax=Lophiotrema nucula TaxID=690887 RepID=A0A6A5Z6W4_9PLEO|nr:hypothetical protein BDV96DRAFT_66563 [Lophiotrema nucula]
MFHSTLFAAFAAFGIFAQAVEFVPFLNFSSPSPYIFHSLATLLQTYPQTLFPNGHTITSVTIPRGTLLYHGRHDNNTVPSPEWLALDIEMAYGIMGNLRDSRMLTYRTTKDVQLVYFDGTSASLMGEGTVSQMVLLYNGTENIPHRGGWGPPRRGGREANMDGAAKEAEDEPRRRPPGGWNPLEDEYVRARGLCKWLKKYGLREVGTGGYEGVVRMNAGFEVIWCDFESPSLKLVSNLNVSAPMLEQVTSGWQKDFRQAPLQVQARLRTSDDEGPHGPGMTDPREPFRDTSNWFWFTAAAKRYHIESRIKLRICGLFSFYEHQLRNQSSTRVEEEVVRLNLTANGQWQSPKGEFARNAGLDQLMKRRRRHYLSNVSNKDAFAMFTFLKRRLSNARDVCAGTDWAYVAQEIVARYSKEIQQLQQLLSRDITDYTSDWDALRSWFASTRSLTHWYLMPFIEYPPDRPYRKEDLHQIFALESPVAKDTLERCATQYDSDDYVPQEQHATYTAVKETLTTLCSTIVAVGLNVEYRWLLDFNGRSLTKKEQNKATTALSKAAQSWKGQVEELMAWLGWVDKWISCEARCGTEVCWPRV